MTSAPSIEIIRQYYTYNIIDSCVMRVNIKLTLFIRAGTAFYIYPFKKYLPRLRARLQDGTRLVTLPHTELSRMLGVPVTLDTIREIVLTMATGVIEDEIKNSENFAVILLPQHDQDYYEEIEISWKEPIKNAPSKDVFTLDVPLNRQFAHTAGSSLYVEIKVNDKYELTKNPLAFMLDEAHAEVIGIENQYRVYPLIEIRDQVDYRIILKDKRDYVMRFPRNIPHVIRIEYKIGIPKMIRIWAWFGLAAGIALLPYNSFLFYTIQGSFDFIAPLTAGIIAFLIGLRILLFHDVELMQRWNWAYIILIGMNVALITILASQCTSSECF